MDLFDLLCSISTSVSSNHEYKKEASAIIQSRRSQFFATYQPQEFSLPDSIMFYIAKNPTSSELYQKMVKTCKYFFVKNPVLIISEFAYFDDGKWKISSIKQPLDLSKILCKFWIKDELDVIPEKNLVNKKSVNQNILSSVMPKFFQCDAKVIYINNHIISFHDLSFLISSSERIGFSNITVKDKNGINVAIEKIVKVAVKAKRIKFWSDKTTLSNITSNTMKELIKLPHFSKLEGFDLNRIPETFDLETFYDYMTKNKTTKFRLRFDDLISVNYKNRLKKVIDEIRATRTHSYQPPYIGYGAFEW